MARRLRERQKVIQGRVPSSARKSKSTDPILLRPRRLSKLSPRSFSARDRALHALADMRHGASLFRAAHDNGVTTRTIKRYIGSALLQDRTGGRIRPTKSDRLIRYLQIPTPDGPQEIKVKGSKDASELARYLGAIKQYLRGDRGSAELLILSVLEARPRHGYDLSKLIQARSGGQLTFHIDSLYRSLSGGAA